MALLGARMSWAWLDTEPELGLALLICVLVVLGRSERVCKSCHCLGGPTEGGSRGQNVWVTFVPLGLNTQVFPLEGRVSTPCV